MGIADFFRPKHRHSDVRVRAEAVKALTADDAAILIQVARSDRDISVRRLAIEKIDEADVLADIAAAETERSLRDFAGERAARLWRARACGADAGKAATALSGMIKLGDQFALVDVVANAETAAVKKRAFDEIRDPRALAELAKRDASSELRLGAVARIDDGDVLRALAIDTTSKEVGLAAVDKLDDADRLENIAQKAKNKAVRGRARKIVSEMKDAERVKKPTVPDDVKRRRAEKAQLVREVEGLAETFDFARAADTITAAEAAWAALAGTEDDGDDRFTKAAARFWKRKEAYASQQRTPDELRAIQREAERAKANLAIVSAAVAPAPVVEPPPPDPAREAEAQARREERERQKAEDDARRAAQAAERAARDKEMAERALALAETMGALVTDMETLVGQPMKDTRRVDKLLAQAGKAFDQIGRIAADQRTTLTDRYTAARGKLVLKAGELREAEDWERWSNVPKAEALIATAKEWLAAPATPDLGNRLRGLQALWKEVGAMPQRRSKELWDQFKVACDAVYDKVRAERAVAAEQYGDVAKAKEALIAEAEALAESTDWAATAEKLKALQASWRTSGHLPRKQGDELWKRFRSACDKFFERRKPVLDARSTEEADNLAKKHALIAKANAIADGAPGTGGWGKAISDVRALQQQWKDIGHVPRRDADTIYKAFRAACDRLFAKRDESRDAEANAHRDTLAAIDGEIAAVIAGGDDVVARAIAVRDKAAEHDAFAAKVQDMIRHVVTAHAAAVAGTPLDPAQLRARREKLIARAVELLPKQAAAPVADVAQQLKAAMQKNAFGDLRWAGREPIEVVAELVASWADAGPFFDASDTAQTKRFEATIAEVRASLGLQGSVPVAVPDPVPVVVSEAITRPTNVPQLAPDAQTVPTRAKTPSMMPAFEPADAGWDLGDEDPTTQAEPEKPPAEDPRAAEAAGTTPSSSEMAGDGATEGDGLDAGWD